MGSSGQAYTNSLSDLGKFLGLIMVVVAMLWVGVRAESMGRVMGGIVDIVGGQSGYEWRPTPSKDPWMLAEADMNYQRVVMNLTDKPGFRWLALQGVLTVVGVGLFLAGTWKAVGWMYLWLRRMAYVMRHIQALGVRMSGTVQISAGSGIIYFANVSRVVAGAMEEYVQMLVLPEVVVVERRG